MLILRDQGEISERSKLLKIVLSSSPSEGGFCSSETKHDRRTARRSKLFVAVRKLQKERPEPRKTVLGSSDGENAFVAWKLRTIEEWNLDNIVCFAEEITGSKVTNPKSALVLSPVEDVGFRENFSRDIQRYASNDQAYGKFSGNKY
jgi:hypothetical protein